MPRKRDARHLITPQSPVQIPTAQLVLTVAKSGYRRVIRKAGVARRRPFCVLSPVLATSSSVVARLESAISASRANRCVAVLANARGQIRPKLSVVSLSRPVRVIEGCERSYRAQLANAAGNSRAVSGHIPAPATRRGAQVLAEGGVTAGRQIPAVTDAHLVAATHRRLLFVYGFSDTVGTKFCWINRR